LKTITKPENVRSKRFFDVSVSILLLSFSFFVIFFVKNKLKFIVNIFAVITGRKTWIGYAETFKNHHLPKIKTGVLSPADAIEPGKIDIDTLLMLNEHYAKNYNSYNDLKIILKSWSKLGN
jgi:lipopolysaccharide/colanic/teichoic acid biosynthesis glycosyltransferase